MPTLQDTAVVGRTMTFDGREVLITRLNYDANLPFGATEEIAVNVAGSREYPSASYGFMTLDDAKRFLSSPHELEYVTPDRHGNTQTAQRVGLGIPPAMITWY